MLGLLALAGAHGATHPLPRTCSRAIRSDIPSLTNLRIRCSCSTVADSLGARSPDRARLNLLNHPNLFRKGFLREKNHGVLCCFSVRMVQTVRNYLQIAHLNGSAIIPARGLPIRAQRQPGPHFAARSAVPMVQESAFGEPTAEPLLCAGLLAGLLAPALPRAPQFAGEGFLVFVAHATVREEGCQHVHLRPVGLGGLAYFLWRLEAFALPCRHPRTIHARTPGSSPRSFSASLRSCSAGGIVTAHGMSRMRRQIAGSVPRISGLWFVERCSAWVGLKSNHSAHMKRALMVSWPVRSFTSDSARRRPSSVSEAVTNRAPLRRATSFGTPPERFTRSVSVGVRMA